MRNEPTIDLPTRPLALRRLACVACCLAAFGGVGPARGQATAPRRGAALAAFLDRTRPHLPEGLAMVVEILAGGQLAPGRGWYDRGASRTRFDWESVAARLDLDRDGRVARGEYPGSDRDFRKLDRDRSGRLDREDFAFPANALYRSRSRMLLSFADSDRDGKIAGREYYRMIFMGVRDDYTRVRFFAEAVEDVEAAFKESERMGIPFLGLADLRETVDRAAARKGLEQVADPDGDLEKAGRSTLLRALVNREIGSLRAGPDLGEPAPEFTLPAVEGKGPVTLSKLVGPRPIVLAFGSLTDPAFRSEAGSLEKLRQAYRDRAEFLMVYVREARPVDGWASEANAKAGLKVSQPKDDAGRLQLARDLRKRLGLGWSMAVDRMDDRVGILYSGLPGRLYLLDRQGRVAYKGGRGPLGFKPDELEQSLILLDQADPTPAAKPAGR